MIDHMGIVGDIGLIIAILTVLGLLPFLMARLERTMEQPVKPPSSQTGPRRQADPHQHDLPPSAQRRQLQDISSARLQLRDQADPAVIATGGAHKNDTGRITTP